MCYARFDDSDAKGQALGCLFIERNAAVLKVDNYLNLGLFITQSY